MGQASTDFEVKPPAAPTPSFGSMVTNIVKVTDNNTLWIVNVNGSGNATCDYHLRTLSLPDGTPLSDNPMQYVPGNIDIGKGSLTVQKPAPGHGVRFEVYQSDADKVGNKGCLGQPNLELNNLGQTLTPGKWTVIFQPAMPGELAPGEVSCLIPLAGKGQVFFEIQP